jgi:hypothetical protein
LFWILVYVLFFPSSIAITLRRFPLPRSRGRCSLYPVWFSISIRLHHITPSPVQCRSQINLSRWCFSGGGLTGPVSIFPPTSIYPNLNFELGLRIYKLGIMVDYQSLSNSLLPNSSRVCYGAIIEFGTNKKIRKRFLLFG